MYTNEALQEMAHLLKSLEREQEDLSTRINNLKDAFKAEMTERGVSELLGDDWKITWNTVQSKRFDQSVFKEVHPDLFEKFKTITESRRFVLK